VLIFSLLNGQESDRQTKMQPHDHELLVTGISGALLIIARRWKNKDSSAGLGIAGWTMFLLILEATSK